jgi:hypothetical protein
MFRASFLEPQRRHHNGTLRRALWRFRERAVVRADKQFDIADKGILKKNKTAQQR